MALNGPDCSKAVYGQVTMVFFGGNTIQEAPQLIVDALNLVAQYPPGTGGPFAESIRVLDANGISLDCCPDGYVFDAVGRTCVIKPAVVNPPPPPPPPPPPSPPPPPPDGGDELTINFNLLFSYLIQLIELIKTLIQPQPGPAPAPDTCCRNIVHVLSVLAIAVQKIERLLSQPGASAPPPIDLSAVVTELECVCLQLTAISSSSATVATDLAPGLKSIADAVANTKPTDVSQIVEQLKAIVFEGDIPKVFIEAMVSEGYLTSADAQQLTGSPWSPAIMRIFRTAGWTAISWYMESLGYTWDGKKWVVGGDGTIVSRFVAHIIDGAVGSNDALFAPMVKNAVADLTALITPTGAPDVGEQLVDPDVFLTRAVSILTWVFVADWAAHLGDVLPGESLTKLLETLTGFLGLEEMRDVQIGPLIQFGPARVAEFKAKNLYRQELPGINTLAALHARGLLTSELYERYQGFTGVPWTLISPTRDAAYSGLNARMLLRLAGTGLFSDADIADELTFGAMRPASQHRLMLAAAYLGTEPERNKLRSTLERFYTAGLISDTDLASRLDSAEHNTDRMNLILSAVQLEKQIALAKEYEAAYSHEFVNGLMDAPSYQSALEGIGMQPADVAARMFRDESHIAVTQTLGAQRAARAEARKTQADARKAAIEGFRTGTIDSTALSAALSLAGLTPAQTAAEVGYQVLAGSGVLRWIYGRHLSPQDATLLRQQVQDLTRQREIELLTDAQYVSQLQALSIPPRVIQALRAGANAHISPKTKAILTPPVGP